MHNEPTLKQLPAVRDAIAFEEYDAMAALDTDEFEKTFNRVFNDDALEPVVKFREIV